MPEHSSNPLRKSRVARGLSQPELAVRAHVGVATVQRIEAGGPLTGAVATKLARALGASREEVLGWREGALALKAARVLSRVVSPKLVAVLAAKYGQAGPAETKGPAAAAPGITTSPTAAPAKEGQP